MLVAASAAPSVCAPLSPRLLPYRSSVARDKLLPNAHVAHPICERRLVNGGLRTTGGPLAAPVQARGILQRPEEQSRTGEPFLAQPRRRAPFAQLVKRQVTGPEIFTRLRPGASKKKMNQTTKPKGSRNQFVSAS